MKINSFLKLKHVAWASGALVAAILVNAVTRSGAKASVQAPSAPVVQVAAVEEEDVPVYGEWIGGTRPSQGTVRSGASTADSG